jgi:response regulator RpfG family c-di-GMP phosphodiesterase
MSGRALIVDDDINLLAGLKRQFRGQFDLHTASGGQEALALVEKEGPFAVVVVDMRMPEMDGLDLLAALQSKSPRTVRMMLTGNADQQTAIDAINKGRIFRFFSKPCPADDLAVGIKAGLRQYELETAERVLLENTLAGSVKVLVDVLSLVDPASFGRAARVRDWCRAMAPSVTDISLWELKLAALLAPIGTVSLPPDLLAKYERGEHLADTEREMVARISTVSRDLIANIPRLGKVAEAVYCVDRDFGGTTDYPNDKPAGNAIPEGARLLHILFDLAREGDRTGSLARGFDALTERHGAYDPVLLNKVLDTLVATEGDSGEEIVEMPVNLLLPGQLLKSDLMTQKGWLVLSAGNVLSQIQIERLHNLTKMYRFQEPVRVARRRKPKKG